MVRWAASCDVYHAVADGTRRRMLDLLAERERPVMELAAFFDITQPSVSEHLRVLREAGLVTVRRDGRRRIYRFEPDPLKELSDWVKEFERFWNERLDNLGKYLQRKKGSPPEKR